MTLPDVTLAIAARNEPLLRATVESAFSTRDGINLEVVIVDDGSDVDCVDGLSRMDNVTIFRSAQGVLHGASVAKSYAIDRSRAYRTIVCDAHMRYPAGWLKAFVEAIDSNPRSLICCTSTGYQEDSIKRLYGCKWEYSDKYKFIGPVWIQKKPSESFVEVPALMGACYGFTRDTWDYLPGLPAVKGWGWLEAFLSASANLMGVPIYLLRDVVVGHKYRDKRPYHATAEETHHIRQTSIQILFDDLRDEIQRARYGKTFDDSILNEKGREQRRKIMAHRVMTDQEWLTKNGLMGLLKK